MSKALMKGIMQTWLLSGSAPSLLFVYSLDYTRTHLASDAKATRGSGAAVKDLVDVYRETLESDGIAGHNHGFNICCLGILVYCGLYFGMYNSLKPVVLTRKKVAG